MYVCMYVCIFGHVNLVSASFLRYSNPHTHTHTHTHTHIYTYIYIYIYIYRMRERERESANSFRYPRWVVL